MGDNLQQELESCQQQLKFEQFVQSFYFDFLVNHLLQNDEYSKVVLETIRSFKEAAKDDKELQQHLYDLPGAMHVKLKNGELKDLLPNI